MAMGTFSGDPHAIWLTEPGDDRRMQLLEALEFVDPSGKSWLAPKDALIDGASIPRALWTLVGSPYTGDYRRASILHDVACDNAHGDAKLRREADRMYYHGCRAGGCSIAEATIQFIGVRIGALTPFVAVWTPSGIDRTGPQLQRSASDSRLEADFRQIAEMVFAPGETDDVDEIEGRVDAALSRVTFLDARRL